MSLGCNPFKSDTITEINNFLSERKLYVKPLEKVLGFKFAVKGNRFSHQLGYIAMVKIWFSRWFYCSPTKYWEGTLDSGAGCVECAPKRMRVTIMHRVSSHVYLTSVIHRAEIRNKVH